MTYAKLAAALASPPHEQQHCYYASGPVSQLLTPALLDDLGDVSALMFPNVSSEVSVWISAAHVVADAHYDTSENLYVPVLGTKIFRLLPPDAYPAMRLHPSLHAYYRQARVDLLAQSAAWARSAPMAVLEVAPGSMLYLPPFWFHHVTQQEHTVAVNVWSNSRVYAVMEDAFARPVPLQESWGRAHLALATQLYLRQLAIEALGALHVLRSLFQQRYEGLLAREEEEKNGSRMDCEPVAADPLRDPASHRALVAEMADSVHVLASLFRQVTPVAVREIYLGNYAEQLALRALGLPSLPFFLRVCLPPSLS